MIDLQELLSKIKPFVLGWMYPHWTYLQSPLTSTAWDGDAYSTTAKTLIDLSAVFGVPAGVAAVLARTTIRDSGSAAADCFLMLSPNASSGSGLTTRCSGLANDAYTNGLLVVPCDSNGDIYYQLAASGADTMDVRIEIWGYVLNNGTVINSIASHIFGTSPNYAMFDTDGTLRLFGTATVWDDVVVNLTNIKAPASDPPTWRAYKSCELPAFGKAATNVLYFTAQIPHKWREGSDINFHFHTAYPDGNAGNSRWQFTYAWANINGAFPAAATSIPLTFAAPAVADHHSLHSFGSITASGKTMSSVLLCSLARLGADGADDYNNDIYAISADFHVEFDTLGSSQELVK